MKRKPLKDGADLKPIEHAEGPFKFTYKGQEYQLTLQAKEFCETYLSLMGNGTEAMWLVYKPKNRIVAGAMAAEYLEKPNICAYINMLLPRQGFSDTNVRTQHNFVLNQHRDFHAKNKAIDMYYKLKGSYAPEEVRHYTDPTPEQIDAEAKQLAAEALAELSGAQPPRPAPDVGDAAVAKRADRGKVPRAGADKTPGQRAKSVTVIRSQRRGGEVRPAGGAG